MKTIYLLMLNHNGEKDSIVGAYSSRENAFSAQNAYVTLDGMSAEELFVVQVDWDRYPIWETEIAETEGNLKGADLKSGDLVLPDGWARCYTPTVG